ncbi:hypothetical protein SLEP1_g51806 [Rubroshorea leprosula]|uniref:Uncharacterized protein n=1 Tax=Rubroshorea leprosula TaxID=152421 RepID=A0AAV5M4C3_9ROSI|nr:hypothetical protein SLEP1_g51806 [Rubroshorea leprosula]
MYSPRGQHQNEPVISVNMSTCASVTPTSGDQGCYTPTSGDRKC